MTPEEVFLVDFLERLCRSCSQAFMNNLGQAREDQ